MPAPEEYAARLNRWRTEAAALTGSHRTTGNSRLIVFFATCLLAWFVYRGTVPFWTLAAPLLAFILLAARFSQLNQRRTAAARAIAFYQTAANRLTGDWIGRGSTGEEFLPKDHVYAEDLDLFGNASAFEFLSRARTLGGEATLADWLLFPASCETAQARQQAVRELAPRLDLREDLALLGEDIRAEIHPDAIERWGAAPPVPFGSPLRLLALALSLLASAAVIAWLSQLIPLAALTGLLVINGVFLYALRRRVQNVLSSLETAAHDLAVISSLLARLEQEAFEAPLLRRLRERLTADTAPASERIAHLQRWIELLESGEHLLIQRVLRPVLLWHEQVAMAIEAWRQENGRCFSEWIAAVSEFEALSSLASLAYERPLWTFPLLLHHAAPQFEATALRHPLLPADRCVPNDVQINPEQRLLIISGSNMSGKSTLLRSIALNCVFASAGAPVAAANLRLSALQIGASIRVSDSLQDNRSRFFAEIVRLRQIVDLTASSTPVLFLLDELLSGTNSHDRRIGATAIVRALIESGALGAITTHDLALAEIQTDLQAHAVNLHFEDAIVDGKVQFDYRLRPGVVTRSNALELMRMIGLKV